MPLLGHSRAYKRAKIFHRDISAGNILIDENGEGILIDWDLSLDLNKPLGTHRAWLTVSTRLRFHYSDLTGYPGNRALGNTWQQSSLEVKTASKYFDTISSHSSTCFSTWSFGIDLSASKDMTL